MNLEITGILGWVFTFTILLSSIVTMVLGVWLLWEKFLWDYLITRIFKALKCWKLFIQFIYYRKQFLKWKSKNISDAD